MTGPYTDLDFQKYFAEKFSDEIVFMFSYGIGRDNGAVDGRAIFGKKGIAVVFSENDEELQGDYYLFSGIKGAKYYSFTSICFCEIEYNDELVRLLSARGNNKMNVSQFVRIINEVCDGSLIPENAEFIDKRTVCPKCGSPYPRGTMVCPHCDNKGASARKIKELLSKHLFSLILTLILFIVTISLRLLLPAIQSIIVDDFFNAEDKASILNDGLGLFVLVILSMVLTRILLLVFTVLRTNLFSKVSNAILTELRTDIYSKIQTLSVAGISKRTAGDLINRVSSDTSGIAFFLAKEFPNTIEQILLMILVAIILGIKNWQLTILLFLPMPAISIIFLIARTVTRKHYFKQWAESSRSNTLLHDIFQGVRVVKVYGTEKNEIKKYDRSISSLRDIQVKTETLWAKIVPYAEYFFKIGSFIIIYAVGSNILKNGGTDLTLGDFILFTNYASNIYGPMRWMASVPKMFEQALTSMTKIFEIIDEEPDVADAPNPKAIDIKGNIEVKNIYFGYNESENVLENLSVDVKPGEFLGIVGRSGCGKSTLINLIMRLYDVDKGQILIDGVDIRDISQNSLRSQIGVVLQETFLFAGTIYENIAYAKPNATYDEVINASRLANAHDYIMKLPDGYNTRVGEKGYTISGGERQRIAIARAVLHDPKILILDEATSALDTETEKMVQDALQKLCANRTTIAIAHRLSTLRNATKLVVIDKKKVAECGTHEELIRQKGKYYELVMAQRQMSKMSKNK